MGDDVTVVVDDVERYDDGTLARIRVLSVPVSEKFSEGLKYTFHYGETDAEHPIIRFDNHHGPHELHLDAKAFVIEFEGLTTIYEAWRAALPPAKRADWPPRL